MSIKDEVMKRTKKLLTTNDPELNSQRSNALRNWLTTNAFQKVSDVTLPFIGTLLHQYILRWEEEDLAREASTRLPLGPIREVMKRELVAGVYCNVHIGDQGFGDSSEPSVHISMDHWMTSKDLRDAAAALNQVADFLDELPS